MPATYLRAKDTVLAGREERSDSLVCKTVCSKSEVSGDYRLTGVYLGQGAAEDCGTEADRRAGTGWESTGNNCGKR